MRPASELANRISIALISASCNSRPTRTWNSSLEQVLHRLGCRESLSPSLVSRVIDPFLLSHHSLALGFFNWTAQQPGFVHDSSSYKSIFKSLSISRQFNAIDSLLKQSKAHDIILDTSVYRSVIDSFIIGKKTQHAFSIFKESSSLIRDIGPRVCNSLLGALASDGYLDYAHKVFDEMSRKGVSFSTIGFGLFIRKLCINTNLDYVLSSLDRVKGCNSDVNGSILALLIVHALCKASREIEAFKLLDELRSRECKPDFMAYRIIAEAFGSKGCVYEREMVLKKKRKLGVAPRNSDYREFVLSLISERRIAEAKELGEVIVSGNFPLEDDVSNALIGSVSATDPHSAIMFLNSLTSKGKSPTLLTLSNLSRNLCKHGKADELVEVYEVLSRSNYFQDTESYTVKVSFLCKAGRVREAYHVLHEMKKKGLGPNVSLYNVLMEACCREGLLRPAKRLWDEMFTNECIGNLRTYNILIKKLSEEGQVEEALRLFHHMSEKEVLPDATTYTFLLEGLCQETKLEDAFDVFNKSVKQDTMLAQSILSGFILHLCRNGWFLVASDLLHGVAVELRHVDSHVVLLKHLADAKEIQMGIEHVKWVRETSPMMVKTLSNELLASLPSSSTPELILPFLRALEETCRDEYFTTYRGFENPQSVLS